MAMTDDAMTKVQGPRLKAKGMTKVQGPGSEGGQIAFPPWNFGLGPWTLAQWSFLGPCALVIGHLLTACSPQSSAPELHSRSFSHAEIIGTRGTGLGQFTKPRSLALDRDDNLFVVDMTGRVQKFSPRGEILSSWRMPETDLGKPKGMCRDTNGNIVIVEPHYQRVNHFAPDGTLVEQWGSHGTNLGQLVLPRSVVVNRHGDIFLSEYTSVDRVQGFSANHRQPIVMFGKPGTGDGAEGLDVDAQDRIYVADSCNHRIQIFSRDGKWLKTYGQAGRGLGELSYPYDVRVDRAGRQYVCEFGNSRIQVFGTNNEPLEIIGGPGARPGQFNNPWAIALDSHGNIFVADAGNHRVQKLVRRSEHTKVAEANTKIQDPRSKEVPNNKHQTEAAFETATSPRSGLDLGPWGLFGVWSLVLGAFYR
jgi:DNA-binding beta-propeller fold protein YncE